MAEPPHKKAKLTASETHEDGNKANQSRSTILKLPPEIRCQIWRALVISPAPIKPRRRDRIITESTRHITTQGRRKKYYQMRKPTRLTPAFTCRTIYHEMTPLYYSENLFDLDIKLNQFYALATITKLGEWSPSVSEFATAIGAVNFGLIKRVRVDCSRVFVNSPPHWPVPFRRLGDFSVLQLSLSNVRKSFRKDVKIVPFHHDDKFSKFMTRHVEKALQTLKDNVPLIGSRKRPVYIG